MKIIYKLKYLPLAQKDLRDITFYISHTLKNTQAAIDLVDALDNSISKLQTFPYANKVYQPVEPLETEYRISPVKSYLVFYVVTDHEIEIHRIVYAKRNLDRLFHE